MQPPITETVVPLPKLPTSTRRVLLAEDDEDLRRYLAAVLRARGYEVIEASNGIELLVRLQLGLLEYPFPGFFDAVVTDVRMPGVTGMSVLDGLAVLGLAARVVVISGFADRETTRLASRQGAAAVLSKPFETAALLRALDTAFGRDATSTGSERRG